MKRNTLFICLLLLFGSFSCTQKKQKVQKIQQENMKDFKGSCYCSFTGKHPITLIKQDNNWELVAAFRGGKTLKEIENLCIKYTEKQVENLKKFNFIEQKGDKYYSLVPILGEEEMKKLRSQTKTIAKDMVNEIENDFDILSDIFKKKGFENNTFTYFFSYVLDDIVWDIFEKNNQLPERELGEIKANWAGLLWYSRPARSFSCGTNKYSNNNISLMINWSYNQKKKFNAYEEVYSFLSDYLKNGKCSNKKLITKFFENGIVNKKGNLKVPVIETQKKDELHNISHILAQKIANFSMNKVDYSQMQKDFFINKKQDAIIIIYHEIMYDILDILEQKNKLKKPKLFDNSKEANLSDMKDLILLIKS